MEPRLKFDYTGTTNTRAFARSLNGPLL